MANFAILASALNPATSRTKGLFLDGFDVIKQPTGLTSGMGYGVPIESVHVTEAGPGGVSAMTFIIDDPIKAVTVSVGMQVRFQDFTNDLPDFLGWVQAYTLGPGLNATGRTYSVTCVGIETVLDWGITTSHLVFATDALTITGSVTAALQAVVGVATGVGPIRDFSGSLVGIPACIQSRPVQQMAVQSSSPAFTVTTGTTIREGLRQVLAQGLLAGVPSSVTVDFYYGLRIWASDPQNPPDDYTTMTIDNSVSPFTEGLTHDVDGSSDIHTVMVVGTGAAAMVLVNDGSGIMGQVAVLNDASITTVARASNAGSAYLASFRTGVRGTFDRRDFAPTYTVHTGSLFTLTEPTIASGAVNYTIMQIDKTFNAVRENWTIQYGGLEPRASSLIRRLTRSTLS